MENPTFEPVEYRLPVVEAVVTVRVMPDLIKLLWGAGVGPQDAQGIVEAGRKSLDELAGMVLRERGSEGGVIELSEADWNGDEGVMPITAH